MLIAVVEWGSDKGDRSPEVFVADTFHQVRRRFVQIITGEVIDLVDLNDIDATFVTEFPVPDLDDEASVQEFVDAVKEASTDAWLTVYHAPGTTDAEDTWEDVRDHKENK